MPIPAIVPKPTVHNFIDLEGQTFGRLTVVSYAGKQSSYATASNTYPSWNCECGCGKAHVTSTACLINNRAKSCGCLKTEQGTTHGMTGSITHQSWDAMLQRCNNPNNKHFHNYGGRNISVTSRWNTFQDFFDDMGERPNNMTLDRIDNDKGYCKENCKWSTRSEQQRNHRLHKKNKTGVTGVFLRKNGRFRVSIYVNNKTIYIGTFDTIEEAAEARKSAEATHWK